MTIDQSIFGLNYLSMANAPYCLLKLYYCINCVRLRTLIVCCYMPVPY